MPDPLDPSPAGDPPRPGALPPPGPPRPPPPLDWRERLDEARRRWGDGRRVLAGLAVGAVAVGLGLWLLRPAPSPVEEAIPPASTAPAPAPPGGPGGPPAAGPAASTAPTEVVAHAAGAVARPGVYRLDPAARVDDLVRAAGGLGPDADASRLNLAAPLADGARVYVPRAGEEVPPAVGPEGGAGPATAPGPAGAGGEATAAGPVDLNTADEAALDELPGVGPATAAAIISHREENGGFRSVDELIDVRGIGEAKLEQLRPLVTV
ncbi:MAG TPA: helix-hairpin-helix domain-containing protein [Acidimicrobiales bacterium]|nr:helix-hairpin-helix domain-containing protein [Acidimicrobiales bacterium]